MSTKKDISNAAAALGRKGGSVKSQAKADTARENGAKGGKPRKYNFYVKARRLISGQEFYVGANDIGLLRGPRYFEKPGGHVARYENESDAMADVLTMREMEKFRGESAEQFMQFFVEDWTD